MQAAGPAPSIRLRRAPLAALVFLLALAPAPGHAAILNSLRSFDASRAGWAGSGDAAWNASDGNTEETALKAGLTLQWRGPRDTVRLLGSMTRKTTRGAVTERAVLGHLRHNHGLGGGWSTLAFLQMQENPFQRLKLRTLAGAGLRWDAVRREHRGLAVGAAHMWEREHLAGEDGRTTTTRLSAFVSLLAGLRPGVDLDLSAFYQPRWSEFGDWRALIQAELAVALGGRVDLFSGLQLEHDSRPPAGVGRSDRRTSTGVRVRF